MNKNEQTRKRINEIYAEKEVLEQERKMIQEDCSHDSYQVKDFYWRIASSYPAKICDYCDANIGEPSEEDMKDYKSPYTDFNLTIRNTKED